jgi:hypothetical protein
LVPASRQGSAIRIAKQALAAGQCIVIGLQSPRPLTIGGANHDELRAAVIKTKIVPGWSKSRVNFRVLLLVGIFSQSVRPSLSLQDKSNTHLVFMQCTVM